MQVANVRANNVANAVSFARRELFRVPLKGNREIRRSGGEDGLYRVALESGLVVEVTVARNLPATGALAPL